MGARPSVQPAEEIAGGGRPDHEVKDRGDRDAVPDRVVGEDVPDVGDDALALGDDRVQDRKSVV
jgi:hypothetical protein